MPGNHEPIDDAELRAPDVRDARGVHDDDVDPDLDERERVARRPSPLPSREEDEEELAEADILEEWDVDDFGEDDED